MTCRVPVQMDSTIDLFTLAIIYREQYIYNWITISRDEASSALLDFMGSCIQFKREFGNVGVSEGRKSGESRN